MISPFLCFKNSPTELGLASIINEMVPIALDRTTGELVVAAQSLMTLASMFMTSGLVAPRDRGCPRPSTCDAVTAHSSDSNNTRIPVLSSGSPVVVAEVIAVDVTISPFDAAPRLFFALPSVELRPWWLRLRTLPPTADSPSLPPLR